MSFEESDSVNKEIEALEAAENEEFDSAFDEAVSADSGEDDGQDFDEPESTDDNDSDADDEPEPDDDLAKAVRERDQWQHKYKSEVGRIAAYQRQIAELQAAKPQTQGQAKEQIAQKINDSSWNELKEDFPEIANAVEKHFESQFANRFSSLEQKLQPLERQAQEARMAAERQHFDGQMAALEAAHPDYQTVVNSQEWRDWLSTQPQPVQQLVHSTSAADAAYLLDGFKLQTGNNKQQQSLHLQQQRKQRLAASVAVPSKKQVRREVADDDFDSAWDAAVREHERGR